MANIHPSIHGYTHPSVQPTAAYPLSLSRANPTHPPTLPLLSPARLTCRRHLSPSPPSTTHVSQFRRAPVARSTPPSSHRSAPPSPPARIGAQAVHHPPWLARVSAATTNLAGIRHIRRRRGQRSPDPAPAWPRLIPLLLVRPTLFSPSHVTFSAVISFAADPWHGRKRQSRTGADGGRGAGPEEHGREVQGEHYPWRRRRRTLVPCSPLPSPYPPFLPSPGRCC